MSCCYGGSSPAQNLITAPKTEKKVVILGESGVGKTSILNLYVKGEFMEGYQVTLGGSFIQAKVPLNEATVVLDVWDTAGQERFRSLVSMFYRHATAAVVVFDVSNRESYEMCEYWVNKLQDQEPECLLFLVANKIDKSDSVVSLSEAEEYAKAHNMEFTAVSAKTNTNISQLFTRLAESIVSRYK